MSAQVVTVQFQCNENHPPEIFELDEQLEEVTDQFDGEYDISVRHGQGILHVYGVDADQVFTAIRPLLLATSCMKGATATLRYGSADDKDAREVAVTISPLS